ncbi:MAG TPA: UrcA family protein [Steroidobacteraceae bacterium]|nr:UrcA family protein [Steroidobacteraceae bacterium]
MNATIIKSLFTLTLAASFASLAANAGEPITDDNASIKVSYERLDFTKPDAVADLYKRIQTSARRVCNDASSPWDASREETFKRCYSATLDKAVAQVNRPQLTALHQGKAQPVRVGASTP